MKNKRIALIFALVIAAAFIVLSFLGNKDEMTLSNKNATVQAQKVFDYFAGL